MHLFTCYLLFVISVEMVDIWNYPSRNDGQLTRTRGSDDLSLASYLIFLNCEWFVLLWGFNGIICVPSHCLVRSRCSGNTGSLSFSTVGFWQLPKYWENLQDALMKRHKFVSPLFISAITATFFLPPKIAHVASVGKMCNWRKYAGRVWRRVCC